ncbi:SidE phosphodiesterase domain-containing protein [Legionella erythra]|uniref:SidE PDE domain-containing protein n=1 Tax=Legionella erythra TaxID=448 RepID=A0A0W0TU79_LEGER|nr:SidE phosphodiesterase domain-containing protein [Legionella erythra]KTC99165.1 hypothetical protein Lery_0558 [Legionella erythra]
MLTLQIKRLSTEIFEIYINNQLVRYLPRQKSDQLETSIHDYAAKNGVDSLLFFSLPQDEPLPLYLSPDNQAELRDILLYQQKKPIEFPDDLMLSKEKNHRVIVTYSDLSAFKFYWQDQNADFPLLWQQLSRDLIENPYVDDPQNYEVRYDHIAFHINHGTASGLRTMTLVHCFWELLKQSGCDEVQTLAKNFRSEEIHCLKLASFLLRSGRTNELSWDDDPRYSPRSAFIFTTIATELGYDPDLIKDISDCFDFDKELASTDASSAKHWHKKNLYQLLLKLAHQCDLIRCKPKLESLSTKINALLTELIIPPSQADTLTEQFLLFAALLCKNTGSPVMPELLRHQLGMDFFANPTLAVSCANQVTATLKNLDTMQQKFLPHFDCSPIMGTVIHPRTLYLSLGADNSNSKEEVALDKDPTESQKIEYHVKNSFFSLRPEDKNKTEKPGMIYPGIV